VSAQESVSEVETYIGQIPLPPNDRIMVKIVMGRGDLQFNMGFEPRWGPGIPHSRKLYALSEVSEGVGISNNFQ
jgi:hypothetical protein